MKMRYFSMLALFLSSHLFAYEMNGVAIDNNDGTFSVIVESQNGESEFYGNAYKQADGTLTITVNGQSNETYIGTANLTPAGHYQMILRNNTSGNVAHGMLAIEE